MPDINRSQFFTLVGLLCVVWAGVYLLNPFGATQSQFTDLFAGQAEQSNRIVLVTIDDESLSDIGQWPWPRSVFAQLLENTRSAATVGIDVNLSEPSRFDSDGDEELAKTLQETNTSVVLPAQLQANDSVTPLEKFRQPTAVGFSNVAVDSDGVVRRTFLTRQDIPSFALQLYRHHKSDAQPLADKRFANQPHRIGWAGAEGTYPSVSFADVVNGEVPLQVFRNRVVIVGVTASDISSLLDTPNGLMSGPEIHANIADTLISGQFFRSPPWLDIGFLLLLTGLGVFLAFRARNLLRLGWQTVVSVGIYLAVVGVAYGAYIIIDPLYPLIAFVGSVGVTISYEYVIVARQKEVARRSFQLLNTMVKSITDGVIMTDSGNAVAVANPAAKSALTVDEESQLQLDDLAQHLPDDIDLQKQLSEVKSSQDVFTRRDVKINDTYYKIIIAPLTRSSQSVGINSGTVILLQDMTQEKEIERVRENFTSMMVHELRSPLDAIRKMSGRIESGDMEADKEEKYMNLIQSNADQMLTLVNDLLDVAKLESGEFDLQREPASLRDLLAERIEFYEQLAEDRQLQTEVTDSVPEKISIDSDRINQVLNNLLSNAIKFTDTEDTITVAADTCAGSELKEIKTAYGQAQWTDPDKIDRDESYVCISVRDTGDGIAEENLSDLFDKFKQFESAAKSDKKGTGLGLVIIKGITEGHGGVVGVGSTKEEGTEFVIALPTDSS